ncbi:MAG: hypothetical protein WDN44_05285 [Sphingomonas sp.]
MAESAARPATVAPPAEIEQHVDLGLGDPPGERLGRDVRHPHPFARQPLQPLGRPVAAGAARKEDEIVVPRQ